MKNAFPFSAVVLAAGRSRRMGRDKALLEVEGRPLWRRQCELLECLGAAEVLLSVRPDQAWVPPGIRVVRDAPGGAGPLAGVVAALTEARHKHVVVLAVDLPAMDANGIEVLLAASGPGVGAVGRRAELFEPLAAVYPREILPWAIAALERGDVSLQRLLAAAVEREQMRVREISAEEQAKFANWNEPGDWHAAPPNAE